MSGWVSKVTSGCVQRGFNGNVLGGCPTLRCVQRGFNGNVLRGCPTSRCVQRGFNGNVLRGYPMVMYREVCPEGVQNKCPGGGGGGGWCRGFMSWGIP